MLERLYRVSLQEKHTGERLRLYVWAADVDKATHSLTGTLIGPECQYEWIGSGPEHDGQGRLIEREVPDKRPNPKALLKLLDNCKALAEKANKAEAAWEADPESLEKENAFNEAYEWQRHEEERLVKELISYTGGKMDRKTARGMVFKKEQELREILEKAIKGGSK